MGPPAVAECASFGSSEFTPQLTRSVASELQCMSVRLLRVVKKATIKDCVCEGGGSFAHFGGGRYKKDQAGRSG